MNRPLLSIIVVCYNSEQFITQTLESCLLQDFDNYEIIVSNDKSTDNTWLKICEFNNPKIKKFNQESNLGEYANRNFCIDQARGRFILFIDGEDILYPNCLSFISQFLLKYPDAGQFIGKNWNELVLLPKVLSPREFFCTDLLGIGATALNFTSLIINRDVICKVNKFDRKDVKVGDSYIQYKIALFYESVLIPNGFSWWRRRKGQASEELLKDSLSYIIENLKFMPALLEQAKLSCLEPQEANQIEINYYGNILRYCIKKSVFLDVKSIKFLWDNRKLFYPYCFTIYRRPLRNYLNQYSGENPF